MRLLELTMMLMHLLLLPLASSFVLIEPRFSRSFGATRSTYVEAAVDSDNDDDDWIDGLMDPSVFEHNRDAPFPSQQQQQQRRRGDNQNNRHRRGGGRRHQQLRHHGYERDWSADDSVVDENLVNNLLLERVRAKKTGQFDVADEIRDTLLQDHGVSVWDRERLWRSGCSASGSGSKWGRRPSDGRGNNNNNNRRGGGGGGDRFRNNDRGGGQRSRTNFGPNGHDYFVSADAGPNTSSLSEDEIHQLLAERLQCKLSRNFRDADAIENELYRNGVHVHDGYKEWRADGVGFGGGGGGGRGGGGYGPKPGRERNSRSDRNRPYQMSQYSEGEISDDVKATIEGLVQERVDAKRDRDYDIADAIREDLRNDFNVEVDDRKREWSIGGVFGEPPGPYKMSSYSLPIDSLISGSKNGEEVVVDSDAGQDLLSHIQKMVDEREQAKAARDYNTADGIQDDLRQMYNIEIRDRDREWSIGGQFHASSGSRETNEQQQEYTQRGGGGSLTEEQVAMIEQKLQERLECKRQKQFGKADRIRDSLMSEFKIRVDDRNMEWHVVTNVYTRGRMTGGLDEGTLDYIQNQINERALAKLETNYAKADEIRDTLADKFGVSIDDRLKEWTIISVLKNPSITEEENGSAEYSQADIQDTVNELEEDLTAEIQDSFDEFEDISAEEEEAEPATVVDSYEGLTVVQLKELLRAKGLPVSGRKAELIERLNP